MMLLIRMFLWAHDEEARKNLMVYFWTRLMWAAVWRYLSLPWRISSYRHLDLCLLSDVLLSPIVLVKNLICIG